MTGRKDTTMTGKEFILSMYCSACTFDEPAPMTPEEAAYNIAEWKAEGIEIPATVTPLLFSRLWNIYCEKEA